MSSSSANSENVKALTAMGFPESQAIVALLRANNDINRAAELLSNGCKSILNYLTTRRLQ